MEHRLSELAAKILHLQGLSQELDRLLAAEQHGLLLQAADQRQIFGQEWDPAWPLEARERWADSAQVRINKAIPYRVTRPRWYTDRFDAEPPSGVVAVHPRCEVLHAADLQTGHDFLEDRVITQVRDSDGRVP